MDNDLLYALCEEERSQLAWTATLMRRPRCECCGQHIFTDKYLDLEPFGGSGVACEDCVKTHIGFSSEWGEVE